MTKTPPRLVLALLCVCALLGQSCRLGSDDSFVRIDRLLLGTLVQITVGGERKQAQLAAEAAADEIKRVEALTSFHASSELTEINDRAGDESVSVDPELAALIRRSLELSRQTDGAFDPTVGSLSTLWNFSGEKPRVPEASEIADALASIGRDRVTVDQGAAAVRPAEKGTALDLGAVAKGYALDRAAAALKRLGVEHALINAGGDIIVVGGKTDETPWRVGVRDPRTPGGVVAIAELTEGAIVTSGDYERYFESDGVRWHHILDPKTGYPATGMQSVTIVAPDGVTADALATGVFVLGPEKGMRLIEETPDVDGFCIDGEGRISMSSGAKSLFNMKR